MNGSCFVYVNENEYSFNLKDSSQLDDSALISDDFKSSSNKVLKDSSDSISNNNHASDEASIELYNKIINAEDNETILIEPGLYKIHNVNLTKNITLQGNGDSREVIIDGEQLGSIFLINNMDVTAKFYNLTIINGLSHNFGGGICIETGNAYVDNCIFINNTALNNTNGGAISNYGNESNRSYLFVNNSLFVGNHADHDGGAVTTCYAISDIYNSVFINNSAVRDGGAIRVSIYGYGKVQDCIFLENHADEWAGAYYSWAGNSSIDRCIFVNNTAGTNGGAVMVSGSLNLTNSLIANNTGGETGGSFYIQQPMFDAKTVINVNNNIITNNSAPLGQEIFVKWNATDLLFPNFNNNDWGDEDPTDPDVMDPNNVSDRITPTSTKRILALNDKLNWSLLDRYTDILDDYYARSSSKNPSKTSSDTKTNSSRLKFDNNDTNAEQNNLNKVNGSNGLSLFNNKNKSNSTNGGGFDKTNNTAFVSPKADYKKMVELFEDNPSTSKSTDIRYFAVLAFILLVFLIGLTRKRKA
ncbi:MAG: hypothetical protein IKV87_08865 [Methanobrevibacter sp.]|nr:hypothetical protein [Methanobrevibacter sp.]